MPPSCPPNWKRSAKREATVARDMPGRTPRGDWLERLPFATIVYGRSVSLYRNLEDTIFPGRASETGRAEFRSRLETALAGAGRKFHPESMAVRYNEEDHLTLQGVGIEPFAAQFKKLSACAEAIAKREPFARSAEYGYLSANPDHTGAGLSLTCDLCLFGLCITRTLDPALRALERLGFDVPATFGRARLAAGAGNEPPEDEFTVEAPGCRYLVSSVRDVGTERTVLARMDAVCREVARQEQNARLRLLDGGPSAELLDFVHRSVAIGACAKTLGLSEALDIVFAVQFALDMGLLKSRSPRSGDWAALADVLLKNPFKDVQGVSPREARAAAVSPFFKPLLKQL